MHTKSRIARIIVQKPFCENCVPIVQSEVQKVVGTGCVALYPFDSLIVFNFSKANEVSEVLNTLTSLGYPPVYDD